MKPSRHSAEQLPGPPLRLAVVAAVTAALIVLLVLHAFWYDFLSDDALIAARYARNVVEGHGWVWNVGDRVEGYTSFLWVALCAALGFCGMDCAEAARGLSFAFAVGTIPLLVFAAGRLDLPGRGLAAWLSPLLFAASSSVACWALGGLEACGYGFLVLLMLLLVPDFERTTRARCLLAGIVAGLCGLMRPEGVLVALAAGIWFAGSTGRDRQSYSNRWRHLAAFAIPTMIIVAGHLLWRRAYYGDWLPNTFYAKVGSGPSVWVQGARYLLDGMNDRGGIILWAIPFAAPWLLYRHSWARGISFVGLVMLAGVVFVGGDGLAMHRFLVPVMPLWLPLAAKLVGVLTDWTRNTAANCPAWARHGFGIVLVACLAASVAANSPTSWQYGLYLEHREEVPNWASVGRWLHENASPDATVACVPIGAVGYYSRLTLFDMMGLTDRHIARRDLTMGGGWIGHEKHDGLYILSLRPTYLLLGNIFVLDRPLPQDHPLFVRPRNPNIRRREDDIFTPELAANYTPRVVQLDNGRFLHFLERVEPKP